MAARQCPTCLAMIPACEAAAHSNDIVCPGCQKPLEISGFSRNSASFAGLAAGATVWRIASSHFTGSSDALGWILPMVYSYLTFSFVSPLVLLLLADLRLKSLEEASGATHAPQAHPVSH